MRLRPVVVAAAFTFACAPPQNLPLEAGTLKGRVTVTGGTTFDGVTVTLAGPQSETTTTGADGTYAFDALPVGTYTVTITAPQTVEATLTLSGDVTRGGSTVVDGAFNGLGSAHGLAGRDGAGLGGITVTVDGTSLTTVTDETGQWSIEGIPAGSHTVTASADGFQDASSATFAITWRSAVEVPDLLLAAPTGTITGTARLPGNDDRSGITVSVDGTSATTTTDAEGRYVLTNVPLGLHPLRFGRDGCEGVLPEVRVTGESSTIVENGYDFAFDLGTFEVPCATQVGGAKVLEFELNADGTHALFTGEGYDGDHPMHRFLLDVATGARTELIADSIYVSAHFTPDGHRVYWYVQYADDRPRRLFSSPITPFQPVEQDTHGLTESWPVFSDDGTRGLVFDSLVENTQTARALVIDFAANTTTVVSESVYYNGPVAAIDPAGTHVAVFDGFDRATTDSTSLRVIDVATGTSRVVDTGIHTPYAPAFSRDGGLLAWYRTPTTGTQEFRVVETAGTGPARTLVADDALTPWNFNRSFFNTDGSRVLVANRGAVQVLHTDGSGLGPAFAGQLAFGSTDGEHMVLISTPPNSYQLTVRVGAFDGTSTDLATYSTFFQGGFFRKSKDGGHFMFAMPDDTLGPSVRVALADGTITRTFPARPVSYPSITADGSRVVYTHREDSGLVSLYSIASEGTAAPVLLDTDVDAPTLDPQLTTDGGGVIYAKNVPDSPKNILSSTHVSGVTPPVRHMTGNEFPVTIGAFDGWFVTGRNDVGTPFRSQNGFFRGRTPRPVR